MSRVVIAARGQRLTLIEGYGTVPGIVTLIADDDRGGHATLALDAADMGALKVFVNAYVLGLTPGGDTGPEGGD